MTDKYQPTIEETKQLFDEMLGKRLISSDSHELVVHNMNDTMALSAVGTVAMRLDTEDPFKLLLVIDRSGSMSGAKWKAVLDGITALVNYLIKVQSTYGVEILISVIIFNDTVTPVIAYTTVDTVDLGPLHKYQPSGSTAQNDAWFTGLTGMMANDYLLHKDGTRGGRRFAVLMGDGGENSSTMTTPEEISTFMADLRRPKTRVFAAFGFGDKAYFMSQFTSIGILPQNIRVLADGEAAIREALEMVSQSMEHHSRAHSQGQNVASGDQFFVS